MAGRPSTYDFELCKEICHEVAEGKNIKDVLDSSDKYPSFPTWCSWKNDHNELFNLYIKAIQDKSESVLQEIDQILEEAKNKKISYAIARLMIDTLKWKAAKFYPKMFGDSVSVDLTSDGDPLHIYFPDNGRGASVEKVENAEELPTQPQKPKKRKMRKRK